VETQFVRMSFHGKRSSIVSLHSIGEVNEEQNQEIANETIAKPYNYLSPFTFANSPKPHNFIGRFKLVVLGDASCGKTSFINAFVHRTFDDDLPRISINEEVLALRFGGKQLEFVIWDLSGCEEYNGFRYEFYKDTDLFLVCFDIEKEDALTSLVDNWMIELAQETYNTPFMMVGCKHDVRDVQQINDVTIATTSKDEAEKIATDWAAKDYLECSAKTGYNILKVFISAAQCLLTIASLEDKSNSTTSMTLKNFPRYRRKRSSKDIMEIAYGDKTSECLTGQSVPMRRVSAF